MIVDKLHVQVYGGRGDEVSAVTVEVDDSSSFKIGNVHVQVVFTPCHTPGHVCYVATGSRGHPSAVFTGDTMFVGGTTLRAGDVCAMRLTEHTFAQAAAT